MADPLGAWDKRYLWHPFTQQQEWEKSEPMVVASAKGSRFRDARGREFIDAVSSLWVNLHGHRHPQLDRALRRQLGRVAHTTFLGLTHEPAIRLGKALVDAAPEGLERVFYSDNGATAVEVALKMAYQYWLQAEPQVPPRREFLALANSYHGDTLGAVSVGGIAHFQKKFRPLLFKASFALSPHCFRCPYRKKPSAPRLRSGHESIPAARPGQSRAETGCRWECLGDVEKKLRSRPFAAMIVEPIVQGAAGMHVAPPGYLAGVAALCRKYKTLLIADEVATGFGRTGNLFAVERENVRPDFLCLAKGITGGYLPLAATLTTRRIYETFLGRYEEFKAFFHGHSYTANPLACAVALANLQLFTGSLWRRQRERTALLRNFLSRISGHPWVGHVRQAGLIGAIELVRDKATGRAFAVSERVGLRVCRAALRQGVWLRPLGDTIVIMPPYSISKADLGRLFASIQSALGEIV